MAERIESNFKILDGETTEDRRFSYEKVRCLGACGLAPVVMIDDKIHKQVKSLTLNSIIKEYD